MTSEIIVSFWTLPFIYILPCMCTNRRDIKEKKCFEKQEGTKLNEERITSLFIRFLMNNLTSIQNLCERLWIFFTGFATRYLITHRLELHLSSNKITKMYFRPQHLIIFRCFLESKKRVAVLAEPVKIPDHQDPIGSTTRFRSNVFLLSYTISDD